MVKCNSSAWSDSSIPPTVFYCIWCLQIFFLIIFQQSVMQLKTWLDEFFETGFGDISRQGNDKLVEPFQVVNNEDIFLIDLSNLLRNNRISISRKNEEFFWKTNIMQVNIFTILLILTNHYWYNFQDIFFIFLYAIEALIIISSLITEIDNLFC